MCSLEQLHGVIVDAEYKHFRVYMAKTRGSSMMLGDCTLLDSFYVSSTTVWL